MGTIYKITNLINKKEYIGQTKRILSIRWKEHKTSNRNSQSIDNAIRKYGKDNFYIETLEECPNELLNERERYWIKYYNTYHDGYNDTEGGQLSQNTTLSDVEIEKIIDTWNESELCLLDISKQLNHSITTIKNYLILGGLTKEEIYARGKKVHTRKLRKNYKVRKNYFNTTKKILTKKIIQEIKENKNQTNLNNLYKDRNNIINFFKQGLSLTTIRNLTHHSTKMINQLLLESGFSQEQINENRLKKINKWKNIYKYNLNGELLKIYTCKKDLLKDYDEKKIKLIYNCCCGLKKTSLGYKWSYNKISFSKDDYKPFSSGKAISCGKFDINHNLICTYKSINTCAQENGICSSTLRSYINQKKLLKGYYYDILS